MLQRDDMGRTPLHWAACRGYESMCGVLIDFGADARVIDVLNKKPSQLITRKAEKELKEDAV